MMVAQADIVSTTMRPRWAIAVALIVILFGIITVIIGGKTLFGSPE